MPSKFADRCSGPSVGEPAWAVQRRVIGALLLRELLTRYGRNNIGFLWLFVEPMLFTLAITAFWSATRPLHNSNIPIVAFALTGFSSLLLWRNMPSRCIEAVKNNMSLLYHRQVRIIDIYLSRIALELMATTTSFVVLGIIFFAFGWLLPPEDPLQVLGGWLLLAWFGAGLAFLVGGLSERWSVIPNIWPVFTILMFPLSGAAFIVDALPPGMQEVVLWLPMLNALEFLREGWFGSMFRAHYDLGYVVVFNLILTLIGLSVARQVGMDASEA